MKNPIVTVLFPCLNEEKSLAFCINEARNTLHTANLSAEILVADNGSADDSRKIAKELGVRVISVENKGYGAAIRGGIEAALGQIIVMADADGSYDLRELPRFIEAIEQSNADLIIGNRFRGGIEMHAMPTLHRYLGNPVLSFLGRLFHRAKIGDFHCGMRAIRKSSISGLRFSTYGMEFASEMIVKSLMAGLSVAEIPTKLRRDLRDRKSHLRTWKDGWAHLSFLIILSPKWALLLPGLAILLFGVTMTTFLLFGPLQIFSLTFDTQTLVYSSSSIITGMLCLNIWKVTVLFQERLGFKKNLKSIELIVNTFLTRWNLLISVISFFSSIILIFTSLWYWKLNSFGNLDSNIALRFGVAGTLFLTLSLQSLFFNFFWRFVNYLNQENTIRWRDF